MLVFQVSFYFTTAVEMKTTLFYLFVCTFFKSKSKSKSFSNMSPNRLRSLLQVKVFFGFLLASCFLFHIHSVFLLVAKLFIFTFLQMSKEFFTPSEYSLRSVLRHRFLMSLAISLQLLVIFFFLRFFRFLVSFTLWVKSDTPSWSMIRPISYGDFLYYPYEALMNMIIL